VKRVCIVRHGYYPDGHVRRDAETLTDHGYEVDILCLRKRGQESREVIHGVRVYRLPVEHHRNGIPRYIFEYSGFFIMVLWVISLLHLRRKYQVIEVDTMPDFLVFATLLPKLLGAKVVLYVFDHMHEVYAEKFKASRDQVTFKFLKAVEKASAQYAHHVISVNSLCKELLERMGVPGSKISVVLNVPDEDVFCYRSYQDTSNSHFSIITHGSLLERYGIQTLISAVPMLANVIPELELQVVGDGEYRQKLEEVARSLEVGERVHFTGVVPFERVPNYITKADVGVVCILPGGNPMLPNKLFEYVALGKPAVVTSIPAVKAYFDDSSVMFYEPGNENDLARCILELYGNPARRNALVESASRIYDRYRWTAMKYEYIRVFDKLTKQ